jgi:hypothetical protein
MEEKHCFSGVSFVRGTSERAILSLHDEDGGDFFDGGGRFVSHFSKK